jgi:hypothetical protein
VGFLVAAFLLKSGAEAGLDGLRGEGLDNFLWTRLPKNSNFFKPPPSPSGRTRSTGYVVYCAQYHRAAPFPPPTPYTPHPPTHLLRFPASLLF